MPIKNKWWKDGSIDPATGDPNYNGGGEDSGPAPSEPAEPANGGGCDGHGGVESLISADGLSLLSTPDCVDPAEQARRQALQREANSRGQGEPGGGATVAPAYGNTGINFNTSVPWGGGYPGIPAFGGEAWNFGEQWKLPTIDEARNEPGYQFAFEGGLGALQASKAAKGILNTGGTLKDLMSWGNRFNQQNYSNVVDRYNTGYNTRLSAYGQGWDANNQLAAQRFAPKQLEWTTNYAAQQRARELAWQKYVHNTLSASEAVQHA